MAIETRTLKVIGEQTMHCGGCEQTVKFALEKLSGMEHVDASHDSQLINLTYDAQILNTEQIREELDGIGYRVDDSGE